MPIIEDILIDPSKSDQLVCVLNPHYSLAQYVKVVDRLHRVKMDIQLIPYADKRYRCHSAILVNHPDTNLLFQNLQGNNWLNLTKVNAKIRSCFTSLFLQYSRQMPAGQLTPAQTDNLLYTIDDAVEDLVENCLSLQHFLRLLLQIPTGHIEDSAIKPLLVDEAMLDVVKNSFEFLQRIYLYEKAANQLMVSNGPRPNLDDFRAALFDLIVNLVNSKYGDFYTEEFNNHQFAECKANFIYNVPLMDAEDVRLNVRQADREQLAKVEGFYERAYFPPKFAFIHYEYIDVQDANQKIELLAKIKELNALLQQESLRFFALSKRKLAKADLLAQLGQEIMFSELPLNAFLQRFRLEHQHTPLEAGKFFSARVKTLLDDYTRRSNELFAYSEVPQENYVAQNTERRRCCC